VLNGPWQDLLYRRYGVGLPSGTIIASAVPLEPAESICWLQRIVSSHPRVWVIDSATDAADPEGVVAAWLDANAFPRPVMPYDKALLRPYLTDAPTASALESRPVALESLGLHLTSIAFDRWTVGSGEESRLEIRARPRDPAAPLTGRRLVATLVGPDETSWWHWDGPLTPTGDGLRYRATVILPAEAAAGAYTLRAVVYEAERAGQVKRQAEPVRLGSVQVRPR
jgi:hypothetical protein